MSGRTVLALLVALVAVGLATPGLAQFELIHDAPGTVQVATDGQIVFALEDDGRILQYASGSWQTVDEGTDTVQIAADEGRLYALKKNGRLFRRMFGAWSQIGAGGTRQIVASGRDLFALDTNDEVWLYTTRTGEWTKVDDGSSTRQVAADRQTGLLVLKNSGNIWKHVTSWTRLDDGTGTRSIVASAGLVYALKDNGNVWRHAGAWEKADDGTDTLSIAACGPTLYCLKQDGSLWACASGRRSAVDTDPTNRQVEARGELVLLLKQDGKIALARGLLPGADPRQEKFSRLYQE
ncbi:MAG: hypothetical protein HY815_28545 [Candidatus Riflebacteria bacterium]|nr:hypothetical protein [Candidatus Riflebacteria bacterium]